jgi:hypothetical protein
MGENIKTDRRVLKTRKALTEALIHLILEKGYEHVTIKNIIDRANVGRSTFYIHYESKEHLLLDGHNNLHVPTFEIVRNDSLYFTSFFEHLSDNLHIAKALIGKKSGNMLTQFYKNIISQQLKTYYGQNFIQSASRQRLLYYFSEAAASYVMSIAISWIEDDAPIKYKEIAMYAEKGVESVFEAWRS